ncbi:MAG: TIGR00730 family Rossman fold protein [Bdellovibrio sp.]|nr:MAG: TIGR00730 family Rossman fold protein [Bdellovibrio sp.]
MKSVSVFCGSNVGNDPVFAQSARALGRTLAEEGITLVYGGARVGLMGEIADSALQSQGRVIGVIPQFLQDKEIAHSGLSELIICSSMHERKLKMFELSQGFIALPGGFGTLDEVFEINTWQHLGLHKFPVGFLNVGGFYDPLLRQIEQMVRSGFLKPELQQTAIMGDNIPDLLSRMKSYKAPDVKKWIRAEST